jgi:hypothetical protein
MLFGQFSAMVTLRHYPSGDHAGLCSASHPLIIRRRSLFAWNMANVISTRLFGTSLLHARCEFIACNTSLPAASAGILTYVNYQSGI